MSPLSFPRPDARWEEQWPQESLDVRLRRHASDRPDAIAVVDPVAGVRLTYGELDSLTTTCAVHLAELGLREGDVIAVQLPNSWQFVLLSCAATRLNAVCAPLSTAYREAELSHMLGASGASLFVVPTEHNGHGHLRMAVDVASQCPSLERIIVVGDGAEVTTGAVPVSHFDELLRATSEDLATTDVDPDSPTILLFTSGTEATPKGIVHTHNTANYSLKTCSPLWGLTPDDNVLVAAPMGHGAGFQWCHRVALYVGSSQVLMDRWSGPAAAALVASERCNFTYAPTRFLLDLVNEAAHGTRRFSMRRFASGGAPIPRVLVEQAREHMDCVVLATYGQTECFVATTTSVVDTIEKISNTDGCAIPGATVRIVDEQGADVPRGEPGECITSGPHVSGGYLDGTAPGQMSFRDDGFLWTGDRCVMDGDGYIRVLGRTREMIIRNGLNISPAEVEGYLLELPNVVAAAVVGKPDEIVGERTCAFYVAADGAELSLEEVTGHFDRRGVAKYKWPEFVVAIDELPYSAVGKVQRGRLKERAADL